MQEHEQRRSPMYGREVGSLVAGVFGAVFVWVNSAAFLSTVRILLLAAVGVALIVIVSLSVRSFQKQNRANDDPGERPGSTEVRARVPFGWKYWLVVGVEAIALFGGTRFITALGYPELGAAWVALIVGMHFFPLAHLFRVTRFHALGVVMTALGIAGFVLRAFGQVGSIAVISGVASGIALLLFGLGAFVTTTRTAMQPLHSEQRNVRGR